MTEGVTMTEELKQKAIDFVRENHCKKCMIFDDFEEEYCSGSCPHYKDYIAGATENGIQWHDLRKDPNDLPEAKPLNWVVAVYDGGTLWCRARREECVDGVYWVNSLHQTIYNVVLWARIEIPQFKE